MSNLLPPMPNGVPPGSYWWNDWYEKLRNFVNTLSTLAHNSLQSIQGGTSGQYYHLTSAQYGYFTTPTGTGSIVLSNSPTLTTPNLGVATATTIQNTTGALSLQSTNPGSAVSITTGATTGTTVSGNIVIQPGSSQNVQPGYVHVKGADTTGTAALSHGGDVELFGGLGRRVGGSVRLFGGDTTNTGAGLSLGGAFELYGGNGYKTGGPANIIGGSATGPAGVGGYVVIKPGTGSGAGTDGTVDIQDAYNNVVIQVGTIVLGGASALGLFGKPPIPQPTTAHAASTFTVNVGTAVNNASTFDGYTIGQIVKALRDLGALA